MKYLVYLPGLRGPEAQIWHGEIVKSKDVKPLAIHKLREVEEQHTLDELMFIYQSPKEPENG